MAQALTEAFIDLIRSGQVDGDLLLIQTAIQARYTVSGQRRAPWGPTRADGGFSPGDRVVSADNLNPAYLRRRPGVLVHFKLKRWAFRPDDPNAFGRYLHPDGTVGLLPSQFRKETP